MLWEKGTFASFLTTPSFYESGETKFVIFYGVSDNVDVRTIIVIIVWNMLLLKLYYI